MTAEERQEKCAALSREACVWITLRLSGTHDTGYRGFTDMEDAIYGWLIDHADFE